MITGDEVPSYVAERVRRPVPDGCSVISGSTPVLSFGNATTARVATLGLNPSRAEFADARGRWLVGHDPRLATYDSLGVADLTQATAEQVAEVVAGCCGYFQRNPYRWFKDLERLMQVASGSSYCDGSACHLDLVQWATDPVWQHLAAAVRRRLIVDDREFLRQQLEWEQIRCVLLNGRTVVEQVRSMGIPLETAEPATAGEKACAIVVGQGYGATIIGWTANLQSGFGMSNRFKAAVAQRVREDVSASRSVMWSDMKEAKPFLSRGTTVTSKTELVKLLEHWFRASSEETIGDVGRFGGKAWVAVRLHGSTAVLNADTKRDAVKHFLAYTQSAGAETPWHVVANARGSVNRVMYRKDAGLPGWYCYVTTPWDWPGEL